MDAEKPRSRGRPPKTKVPRPPRYPPLPFQATRDRLAAELRRAARGEAPVPPVHDLASVATTGVVSVERAIVGPLGKVFRFNLTADQVATAAALMATRSQHNIKGLAANSRRTRASDWLTWLAFCAHYDRVVLPASFDDLAQFIHELIAADRKKATIEHLLWSIGNVHLRHDLPDPMASLLAGDFWRDRVREDLHGEQHQAAPLRKALLRRLVAALADVPAETRRVQPRLRNCAIAAQQRRRLRDIAMLHVAYDLLTRASELVGLEWGRLSSGRKGSGIYRFGKTKTDQLGTGTEQYLRPETMRALLAWRGQSPIGGYIFHPVSDDLGMPMDKADSDTERAAWAERARRGRAMELRKLTQREVGQVFRRACDAAGVPPDRTWLSGHSARVGAAQDMAAAGLTTLQIQKEGRWKSERMPLHYAARQRAAEAGETRHAQVDGLEPDTDPG